MVSLNKVSGQTYRRTLCGAVLLGLMMPATSADSADAGVSASALTAFSSLAPGPLPAEGPWQHQALSKIKPNRARIVAGQSTNGQGTRFLVIDSEQSASAWAHAVPESLRAANTLSWQWLVNGAPGRSALNDKKTDDFAARVYVVFDYPLDKLSFGQRLAIRLARSIHGDVPAAALCYVWLPETGVDTLADSPYTSRVKMVVATGEPANGQWRSVTRNIRQDFQRAFGEEYGPGVPPIKAIIVSSDTDQSGGKVQASFSGLTLTTR